MEKVAQRIARMAQPVVEGQGCTLWDVEYVKEAGQWYLRVLIDKDGGVDILDCEAISRTLSDLLDEQDPIPNSYTLEVGSAGAERPLRRPEDFQRFMDADVLLRLYRPCQGRKEFCGILRGYDPGSGAISVETAEGQRLTFEKQDVALCRLRADF